MLFQEPKEGITQFQTWLSAAAAATLENRTLEANAALIIQAVNEHAALLAEVAALRAVADLSLRNVNAMLYAMSLKVPQSERQSLQTWADKLNAALRGGKGGAK